jgi:uncharacterized protein (UPF0210 family)
MKIRTITVFCSPRRGLTVASLAPLAKLAQAAKAAYEQAGYEVQTTRLATTPFVHWVKPLTLSRAVEAAVEAESLATAAGFGYISLGPALAELHESFDFIPPILAATKAVFATAQIATRQGGISMPALRAAASIIQKAAHLEPDGFANLRFAALANVPAGSPFFPAAYHSGRDVGFAIGTQAADLAVDAFNDARSLEEGSRKLTAQIEQHSGAIAKVAAKLQATHGAAFGGIDFSLAPFPAEQESLGTAFERMGIQAVGLQGSLAAAAVLTQAIDSARFPRAGFNGLLLPPLEDSTLARRAAEATLTVNDLLMFSAVCGTGLDTVPLPGDASADELQAVLLDLAALALRLDKPLTARLMPIPGKAAGDETQFDFAFFANSRVMPLRAAALGAPIHQSETIKLSSRVSRRAN